MIYRKAQKEDFQDIIFLIQESVYSSCANDYTLVQLNAWVPQKFDLERFLGSLEDCYNIIAVEENKIVAFISVTLDGYINRLFTHSKFQKMGIATKLLEMAEEWAASVGLEFLSLDSSLTSKEFYLHRGFCVIEKTVLKRNDVKFDAILMKKDLV